MVSWNIGAGNENWLQALEEQKPDIVLVQESLPPKTAWDGFRWYGTLDSSIYTRFPVEVLPTDKVGPWTEPQLLLVDIHGKRVLIANVRLMLPSGVIQLVDPLGENPFENYRARIGQYDRLARLVRTMAQKAKVHRIIIAGDFNIPADQPSLSPLRGFLQDVCYPRVVDGDRQYRSICR